MSFQITFLKEGLKNVQIGGNSKGFLVREDVNTLVFIEMFTKSPFLLICWRINEFNFNMSSFKQK